MKWTLGAAAAAAMLVCLASPAAAQPRRGDVMGPPATVVQPARERVVQARYVVIPVSIYANNETGPDWPGSDEVFAVFQDPVSHSIVRTPTFGDVDTGETRYFAQAQACISPIGQTLAGENGQPAAWTCREGGTTAPLAFTVELFEDDPDGPTNMRPSYYGDYCSDAQAPANCNDDRIGRLSFTHSAEDLATMTVGETREFRRWTGGYTFTYRIQRLEDVVIEPTFNRRRR